LVGINNTERIFRKTCFGNLELTEVEIKINLIVLALLTISTCFSVRFYLMGLIASAWLIAKLYIWWRHRRTEPMVQEVMQRLSELPQSCQDEVERLATEALACEARLISAYRHGLESVIQLQTLAFEGARDDFVAAIEYYLSPPMIVVVTFHCPRPPFNN